MPFKINLKWKKIELKFSFLCKCTSKPKKIFRLKYIATRQFFFGKENAGSEWYVCELLRGRPTTECLFSILCVLQNWMWTVKREANVVSCCCCCCWYVLFYFCYFGCFYPVFIHEDSVANETYKSDFWIRSNGKISTVLHIYSQFFLSSLMSVSLHIFPHTQTHTRCRECRIEEREKNTMFSKKYTRSYTQQRCLDGNV